MTDAPQIDDRRRFKELWKELLVARLVPPTLLVLFFCLWVIKAGGLRQTRTLTHPDIVVVSTALMVSASLLLAKRGRNAAIFAGAYSVALVYVAYADLGLWLNTFYSPAHKFAFLVAHVAMGAGYAEGALEGSIATRWSALIGSFASAYAVALWAGKHGDGYIIPMIEGSFVIRLAICPFAVQLGIALSLALGRLIRDLPKRKQDAGEPTQ